MAVHHLFARAIRRHVKTLADIMRIRVTAKLAKRLRWLRMQKEMMPQDVVHGTGIDVRSYLRWENQEVASIRETNLVRVLRRLGTTLLELQASPFHRGGSPQLSDLHRVSVSPGSEKDMPRLLDVSEQIDKVLVSVLQSERVSLQHAEVYKDLLYGGLVRRGLSVPAFTQALCDMDRTACSPRVTIQLANDLTNLTIHVGTTPVLSNQKPLLLWDCSCVPGELANYLRDRGHKPEACPIHSHPRGEELMNLTSREFVALQFNETSLVWRQSVQLWPPSIDSVVMLRNLRSAGVLQRGIESVLDIGCGTGILGISIARDNHSVRRLGLADWLLTPLLHASLNATTNLAPLPVKWQAHLGMFADWITAESPDLYDLLVCTPPYLPFAEGFEAIRAASPVAGIELVDFLLRHPMAREAYITVSSVAYREIKNLALSYGTSLHTINPPLAVPFRVPVALRCTKYIKALLDTNRLDFRPNSRYALWHNLMTLKVSPNAKPSKT